MISARNQIIVNKCKIVTVTGTCVVRAIVAKFNFVKEMIEVKACDIWGNIQRKNRWKSLFSKSKWQCMKSEIEDIGAFTETERRPVIMEYRENTGCKIKVAKVGRGPPARAL